MSERAIVGIKMVIMLSLSLTQSVDRAPSFAVLKYNLAVGKYNLAVGKYNFAVKNNSKKERGCIWGCKVLMSRLWLPASSLQPPGPKYKQK